MGPADSCGCGGPVSPAWTVFPDAGRCHCRCLRLRSAMRRSLVTLADNTWSTWNRLPVAVSDGGSCRRNLGDWVLLGCTDTIHCCNCKHKCNQWLIAARQYGSFRTPEVTTILSLGLSDFNDNTVPVCDRRMDRQTDRRITVSNFNGREQKTVTERNTIRKKSETVSLKNFRQIN